MCAEKKPEELDKSVCSFDDLIPEGWTVVEDVAPTEFDVSKLKPVSFLKSGESRVVGEEIRKRALELRCNFGLADGKRMLTEQDKIPVEFRKFYILLPGTVLRDSDGHLIVPCLFSSGGRWSVDFSWFIYGWDGYDIFARCE